VIDEKRPRLVRLGLARIGTHDFEVDAVAE
jgi:hypothetical protein